MTSKMMLKPSDIYFSQDSINNRFGKRCSHCNTLVGETLDELCEGRISVVDIPTISVMYKNGKWFTGDNKRLWIFRHLERLGLCTTIPVYETSYIPSSKFTTCNGGASVTLQRNPGGRWFLKPSATQATRIKRRSASAYLLTPTSGQPASRTKNNLSTSQGSSPAYRPVFGLVTESSTRSQVCKNLPSVQKYSGWTEDRHIASNDSKGDYNRLNSDNNDADKMDLPSHDLQMINSHKAAITDGSQTDTESEQSLKSYDTTAEEGKTTHTDEQSSGYCIVKTESITCPDPLYIDKRNMIKQWLMNIDTHDKNLGIGQHCDVLFDGDDLENHSVVISEVLSAYSVEHKGNQKKTNMETFMNTKLDVSESTMSSGYLFFKSGSDNFEGNDDPVQGSADEEDIKNDRSFNAETHVRNKGRNVNSIIKAVIEGFDTRLESVLHASAKEMLLQTRSYFTEVVGDILVAYENQMYTYQAEIKELRYQMAKLQVEKGKTGEGCKAN